MNALWEKIARECGVELSPVQHELFSRYLDLLVVGNERMNLTRIVDRATAEVQHVADALTLLKYLPKGNITIADIGSGGGVPGIPLAIARPDARVVLIESTKKKANFLRETVAELGLSNVEVIDQRVEDVGQGKLRETFDAVTVRAVAEMGWLAEWGLPLLKKGGKMLAMKGPKVEEEMPRAVSIIHRLGGMVVDAQKLAVPELAGHVIVVIEKVGRTPALFPRMATEAKGKMI